MKTYYQMIKWVKSQFQLNNISEEVPSAVYHVLSSTLEVLIFSLVKSVSFDQAKAIKG